MKFFGQKKRTLDNDFITRYLNHLVYLGVPITESRKGILLKIGFQNIEHGETVLPKAIGNHTGFNAYGSVTIHKGLPKETIYHMVEWEHDEWHGPYTERKIDYIERPYQRYPRTFNPPLARELSIYRSQNKDLVISEKLEVNAKNSELILHILNLFLEIFGECIIYDENLEISGIHIKKINWKILPKGQFSMQLFRENIEPIIAKLPKSSKRVIWYRFDIIKKKNPDFIAIGQGGFKGYIVFAFPEKNLFILESLFEGNATYVFDENWESLSKRTKYEILSENLQKDRFIHKNNWIARVHHLFR